MKKIGFLIVPLITLLMFSLVVPRMLAGGMSPSTMVVAAAVLFGLLFLVRPKKATTKTADAVAQEVMKGFAADAFSGNEELKGKFYSALNDIGSNCPKSAISKLEKLAAQCSGDQETYAIAMAAAQAHCSLQKYPDAIREYNKALVAHPNSELAITIGSCHQRLGNLKKAIDSYEFAMELDQQNVNAVSSLATAYVAEGDYDTALDYAMDALSLDETCSSALATSAICHGLKGSDAMYRRYTTLAVENGYSEEKIKNTVSALKKRK